MDSSQEESKKECTLNIPEKARSMTLNYTQVKSKKPSVKIISKSKKKYVVEFKGECTTTTAKGEADKKTNSCTLCESTETYLYRVTYQK